MTVIGSYAATGLCDTCDAPAEVVTDPYDGVTLIEQCGRCLRDRARQADIDSRWEALANT